jgi:hypothetical protein
MAIEAIPLVMDKNWQGWCQNYAGKQEGWINIILRNLHKVFSLAIIKTAGGLKRLCNFYKISRG